MVQLTTGSVCGDFGPQLSEFPSATGHPLRGAGWRLWRHAAAGACVVSALGFAAARRRWPSRRRIDAITALGMAAAVTTAALATWQSGWRRVGTASDGAGATRRRVALAAQEEADIVWGVLKSFSLLEVRDKAGSIHRLLQEVWQADPRPRVCVCGPLSRRC